MIYQRQALELGLNIREHKLICDYYPEWVPGICDIETAVRVSENNKKKLGILNNIGESLPDTVSEELVSEIHLEMSDLVKQNILYKKSIRSFILTRNRKGWGKVHHPLYRYFTSRVKNKLEHLGTTLQECSRRFPDKPHEFSEFLTYAKTWDTPVREGINYCGVWQLKKGIWVVSDPFKESKLKVTHVYKNAELAAGCFFNLVNGLKVEKEKSWIII